jgi:hypothetical protein
MKIHFSRKFSGLEFVGHSFAYFANVVFLEDVWIRTQRAAVGSRRGTNLATHLPTNLATHLPNNLATHLPTNLATHLPANLATHLPTNLATHLPTNLATHLPNNLATHLPTNLATHTDKKEYKIFLIYKEIQKGAVA